MTAVAAVSAAAKLGVYLPSLVIMYCIILPLPAASAMAEPDMPAKMIALQHVDLRQPAAESPDERIAKIQQAIRHAAIVHDLGRQDEQRHGEDDVVGVHAVEQLLGDECPCPRRASEIEDRAAIIDSPMGRPMKASTVMSDERDGERAAKAHTPDVTLVGSWSSGALPQMAW